MRILCIGDVFGTAGRRVLAEHLDKIKAEYDVDLCIANGENVAGGKGITRSLYRKLRKYGVDVVTGGNHSMVYANDAFPIESPEPFLLRPLNLVNQVRGFGSTIFQLLGGLKIGVVSLLGRVFMDDSIASPFTIGKEAVERLRSETPIIIVDFHAEATSEKICLATYLDGLASAVVGTHTHVQTADERILPGGTAFISDLGMTGPENSAIGMKLKQVLAKFLSQSHESFEPEEKEPMFNGVMIDIENVTGKAKNITRIYRRILF